MKIAWLLLLIVGGTAVRAQAPGGAVLFTRDELLFLHHMIAHHEQALDLAALVPSRTTRQELVRFARQVDRAQRAEIEEMKSLLALAAERGMTMSEHDLHTDAPMPGILSKAQIAALTEATGARFERLWLEGMIFHHEGALTMGREQQRRQFESRRRPYGLEVLVDEILVVQRAEITQMKAWLEQWDR